MERALPCTCDKTFEGSVRRQTAAREHTETRAHGLVTAKHTPHLPEPAAPQQR